MTEYLRVAVILRPHGVTGTLKALPLTSDNNRFRKLKDAYIEHGNSYEPVVINVSSISDDAVYLDVSGICDRDDAEKLRNLYICVDREHAAPLPEGQYFIVDLIGCDVFDTNGMSLGKLTNVYETGANDVYEITGTKKLLVPALKKLLHNVDIAAKRIELDSAVLEEVGLFDD